METPEQSDNIIDNILVSLLSLTLKIFLTLIWCFYCSSWEDLSKNKVRNNENNDVKTRKLVIPSNIW